MLKYSYNINRIKEYTKPIRNKQIIINISLILIGLIPFGSVHSDVFNNIEFYLPFFITIVILIVISNLFFRYRTFLEAEKYFLGFYIELDDQFVKIKLHDKAVNNLMYSEIETIIQTPELNVVLILKNDNIIEIYKYLNDFEEFIYELNKFKTIEVKHKYSIVELIIKRYYYTIITVFISYTFIENLFSIFILGILLLLVIAKMIGNYYKNSILFYMIKQNFEVKIFLLFLLVLQISIKIINSLLD